MRQLFDRSTASDSYAVVPGYRVGSAEPCPDCGVAQWHIGRQSAECACCGTALPLADPALRQPLRPRATLTRAWLPFTMAT